VSNRYYTGGYDVFLGIMYFTIYLKCKKNKEKKKEMKYIITKFRSSGLTFLPARQNASR